MNDVTLGDNNYHREWEAPYVGKKFIGLVLIVCASIIAIATIAFFWGREKFKFGDGYVLDNEVWGNLGDFIGGLLGAVLGALSFLMMYWTLKAQRDLTVKTNLLQQSLSDKASDLQRELNSQAIRQAELQRFNDLFFELLALYHRQVKELDRLTPNDCFFNVKMKEMQSGFKEYLSFAISRRYAKDRYLAFYLENAANIAPLFRTMYRLFNLIDHAKIDLSVKHNYAKTVRAQLSVGELFFLRYNCLTGYGENFKDLINKFRITKHLPYLSLLENTTLRKKVCSHGDINQGLAINMLIYNLWKEIYDRIVGNKNATGALETFQENSKYCLRFAVKDDTTVVINLEIYNKHRNNTAALRCMDRLDTDTIEKMLNDFLWECFIYSNSEEYNDRNMIQIKSMRQISDDLTKIWSSVRVKEGKLRVSHPSSDQFYEEKRNHRMEALAQV